MIEGEIVFNKTQLGTDEILRRTVGLPSDLRSLLLLIDGRRNVQALRSISIAVRESVAPLLFLEDNGFIERAGVVSSVVPMTQRRPTAPGPGYPPSNAAPAYTPQPQPIPMQPMQPPVQQAPPQQYLPPQYLQAQANAVALGDLKGALIQFVSNTLGADSGHAIGRIQNARDLVELQTVARRIYEVLKEYSGVRVAEKFMQQFEGPLQLR
jgi:hypothetical protein